MSILSIVIPTYNRASVLEQTLTSLRPLLQDKRVRVHVINNASTDHTSEILGSFRGEITSETNRVNIGLEGNIIRCLLIGRGRYVWPLSDHMQVFPDKVFQLLDQIKNGLCFDLGCSAIMNWSDCVSPPYQLCPISDLTTHQRSELFFNISNISAFIIRREWVEPQARKLYQFSAYTYPHLGALSGADYRTTFCAFPALSRFGSTNKKKAVAYNHFRSRYIHFVEAAKNIANDSPVFRNLDSSVTGTNMIKKSLLVELITKTCFYSDTEQPTNREFLYLIKEYPGWIKGAIAAAFLAKRCPEKMRHALFQNLFAHLSAERFERFSKIHVG